MYDNINTKISCLCPFDIIILTAKQITSLYIISSAIHSFICQRNNICVYYY